MSIEKVLNSMSTCYIGNNKFEWIVHLWNFLFIPHLELIASWPLTSRSYDAIQMGSHFWMDGCSSGTIKSSLSPSQLIHYNVLRTFKYMVPPQNKTKTTDTDTLTLSHKLCINYPNSKLNSYMSSKTLPSKCLHTNWIWQCVKYKVCYIIAHIFRTT